MQCTHPIKLKLFGIEVPCRKCIACRIAHSREWAIRLMHERAYHKEAGFVTLTYRPEKLPQDGSLVKADLQKFFKRLRWYLEDRKIRYFAVGDYGDTTGRPHYHVIIFGLGTSEHEMDSILRGHVLSGPLVDAWDMGFVYLGTVTPQSCRYVTDYVFKAFDGEKAKEVYGEKLPPFKCVSRGLGLAWVQDNQQFLDDNLCLTDRGKKLKLPRYYLDKMQGDKQQISNVRASMHSLAIERKLKRLSEAGIGGEALEEYLRSSRYQRDLELRAKAKFMSERQGSL